MVVLNERKYAEDMLHSEEFPSKPKEALNRLVRYYKAVGYDKKRVRKLLEEFLLQRDPSIPLVKWQKTIDRAVKAQWKFDLVEIDSIQITKKEMAICDGLFYREERRLMFALICFAKFYNTISEANNGWVNQMDTEIFNTANVKKTVRMQSAMLASLRDRGLIEFSSRVDNINIRVVCLDQDEESEVALDVTDFIDLGNQYLRYHGESFMSCNMCNHLVRRQNNRQRYCKDCAKKINIKKTYEAYKKRA